MIDGSLFADAGEIRVSSESSADDGERKVIGEGVSSEAEGVGGRFDRGGGVREGMTGRKREADGCRRMEPDRQIVLQPTLPY